MPNNPSIIFPDTALGLKIISAQTGEQVSWLEENGRYEYEVLAEGYVLEGRSGIIIPSRIAAENGRVTGTIEPGNYVGLLKLSLCEKATAKKHSTHIIGFSSTFEGGLASSDRWDL